MNYNINTLLITFATKMYNGQMRLKKESMSPLFGSFLFWYKFYMLSN